MLAGSLKKGNDYKWCYIIKISINISMEIRESCPKPLIVLEVIGALIVIKYLFSLLRKLYILLRKRKNLKKRYGEKSWVFVTGSSDGNCHCMQVLERLWQRPSPRRDSTLS
jgi:hypothetical protein